VTLRMDAYEAFLEKVFSLESLYQSENAALRDIQVTK
jgi:hypothetical protein